MLTAEAVGWFSNKGITLPTLEQFGIHTDEEEALCFPYPSGTVKRRKNLPDGKRVFLWPKGQMLELFRVGDVKSHCFLVEGETDTMRLTQALGPDAKASVVGIPGIESWKPEWASTFADCEQVWVILDNDQDYNVKARVDTAWRNIRSDLLALGNGPKVKRVYLPEDVNDVCEFFARYDLDALRALTKRSPVQTSRYHALDLTSEPPPVRWLVDRFICRGDIHLLIGEPGVGKSWITMALAVAVANGDSTFLGHAVGEHGRVLYVDEENPEDLIYSRFAKLGLDRPTARNIRYLSNAGIRLDRQDADVLVEEALDFEPALVVLDSLTRFHTEDENHAGAMAALFNGAIKPLARETGAAVVLIHHANKTDSNSSYRRSRGSGDITASVDSGFDIRQTGENSLVMATFKSRRMAQGEALYMAIEDTSEGGVRIVGGDAPNAPF
jgi:KaiC/GvpD/RAD55 family RecA-like ATPase